MKADPTLTAEEILLCERLRSLKLSGMADALETQLLDPNADLTPFMERFSAIVNQEWQTRYNKKFMRYLKKALLGSGEKHHKVSGENNHFASDENRQSQSGENNQSQ